MRSAIAILCLALQALPAAAQSESPTPPKAVTPPRLLGPSAVLKTNAQDPTAEGGQVLYVFGGMLPNMTNPQYVIYGFDVNTLEWKEVVPTGEDRPLGRMWHNGAESTDGSQMIVYGGINCYERVQLTTDESGSRQYRFSTLAVEYQYAMEDIWAVDFNDFIWIEVKPARTKRRSTCTPAENSQAIDAWTAFDYSYDDGQFNNYPGVLVFAGILFGVGYLFVWLLKTISLQF